MRSRVAISALALLLPAALLCSRGAARPQIDTGAVPIFEFHSGFWLNLHHTLYYEARLRRDTPSASNNDKTDRSGRPVLKPRLDPGSAYTQSERKAWDEAVSY